MTSSFISPSPSEQPEIELVCSRIRRAFLLAADRKNCLSRTSRALRLAPASRCCSPYRSGLSALSPRRAGTVSAQVIVAPEWRNNLGWSRRHLNEKRPQHSCEEVAGAVIPMRQAWKANWRPASTRQTASVLIRAGKEGPPVHAGGPALCRRPDRRRSDMEAILYGSWRPP